MVRDRLRPDPDRGKGEDPQAPRSLDADALLLAFWVPLDDQAAQVQVKNTRLSSGGRAR